VAMGQSLSPASEEQRWERAPARLRCSPTRPYGVRASLALARLYEHLTCDPSRYECRAGRGIVLFNAIMFLLVEVPLIGYLLQPDATAERVASIATWLNANGLRVMGWPVGAVGIGLIVQGLAAAAG
jgi:Sap, sulfolipid-1-addressing protein